MAQSYRLVGSQAPDSRIDKVLVESSSEDFPDGKYLIRDGEPQELTDEQVIKLGAFVKLEPVKASKQQPIEPPIVDQPGVERPSLSTDIPPNPGTTPDIGSLNKDELEAEIARVRAQDPETFEGLSARPSKDELQRTLRQHYGQEA